MNAELNKFLFNLKSERIKFKKNQIIFRNQELTSSLFLILKGKIEIVMFTLNGEEEVISSFKENDIFANALIFASVPAFLGDVIAREDGELIAISKSEIIKKIKEDERFLTLYIQELSAKTIALNVRAKLLSHKNIRERIIYYLQINKGYIEMTINELSKVLVLPRPSVSRELIKMCDENIIYKKNKRIVLK